MAVRRIVTPLKFAPPVGSLPPDAVIQMRIPSVTPFFVADLGVKATVYWPSSDKQEYTVSMYFRPNWVASSACPPVGAAGGVLGVTAVYELGPVSVITLSRRLPIEIGKSGRSVAVFAAIYPPLTVAAGWPTGLRSQATRQPTPLSPSRADCLQSAP